MRSQPQNPFNNKQTKLLRNINPAKAACPNNSHNRVLKECSTQMAEGLTRIFQKSVNTGTLPDDWLTANVASIFKKGDKHLAKNYRPVSHTSVTSKVLEHIICSHLVEHLDKHYAYTHPPKPWLPPWIFMRDATGHHTARSMPEL